MFGNKDGVLSVCSKMLLFILFSFLFPNRNIIRRTTTTPKGGLGARQDSAVFAIICEGRVDESGSIYMVQPSRDEFKKCLDDADMAFYNSDMQKCFGMLRSFPWYRHASLYRLELEIRHIVEI